MDPLGARATATTTPTTTPGSDSDKEHDDNEKGCFMRGKEHNHEDVLLSVDLNRRDPRTHARTFATIAARLTTAAKRAMRAT